MDAHEDFEKNVLKLVFLKYEQLELSLPSRLLTILLESSCEAEKRLPSANWVPSTKSFRFMQGACISAWYSQCR